MGLHILVMPPSPCGDSFLGRVRRGQWTSAAKALLVAKVTTLSPCPQWARGQK